MSTEQLYDILIDNQYPHTQFRICKDAITCELSQIVRSVQPHCSLDGCEGSHVFWSRWRHILNCGCLDCYSWQIFWVELGIKQETLESIRKNISRSLADNIQLIHVSLRTTLYIAGVLNNFCSVAQNLSWIQLLNFLLDQTSDQKIIDDLSLRFYVRSD